MGKSRKPKGISAKKEEASLEARRRELVGRAWEVYVRLGRASLSVDEIAGELGISKKTIYECFPTKLALLRAGLNLQIAAFDRGVGEALSPGKAYPDKLQALFDFILAFFSKITPSFIMDLRRREPELFAEILSARNDVMRRHLVAFFEEGKAQGQIQPGLNTDFLLAFFIHAVPELFRPALFEASNLGPRDVIRQFQRLLLGGILALEGKPRAST
jgi:AcrR family transcriptional regulator